MIRVRILAAAAMAGSLALIVPLASSQVGGVQVKTTPKLEPVAETKLVMNGLAAPNLRGLGKLLREKPTEAEAWNFARGQALLIGETGNLLLMRPPRTPNGQEAWIKHAVNLRDTAAALARSLAAKDYARSRAGLASLANVCNHCHQAFQVPVRVDPFGDE